MNPKVAVGMGFVTGLLLALVLLHAAKPAVVAIAKQKTRELPSTQIPAEYGSLVTIAQVPQFAAALADYVIGPAIEQAWPI